MNNTIHIIAPRGNTLAVTAVGAGEPLVLLHGFPLDFRMWHNQLASFSHRYQVLAIHLRGFGQSTLDGEAFSMSDLADDVEFARQHLASNQRIKLIGLSMGGYVALEYWRRYSEQLSALVLSNTKPEADSEEARIGRFNMADTALKQGTWTAVSPMLPKLIAEQTANQQPQVSQLVETMMRDSPAASVAAAQRAMAQRRDFVQDLTRFRVPTLVVTGQLDPISPVASNEIWSKQIPGARLETLPNSGHLPPLETPEPFNRILYSFLDGVC